MLPISLRPDGRRAVIVGGGNVALRKVESLIGAGFPIFVVAERIGDRLRSVLTASGSAFAERSYQSGDLDGALLAIAATDDAATNARVIDDARAASALACDATQPERGNFTMAATVRIGDLTISADTGGSSPAFSRRVVRELSETFGPAYGDAVRTLARMRAHVIEAFPSDERSPILRTLAEQPIAELAAMAPKTVVCATRRSTLAMTQSRIVAARLAERGIASTMLAVTTTGDRDQERPIDRLGDSNVFVKELESALRDHTADYAVHSCKDLASSLPDDMRLAAISRRDDARDAFCSDRYSSFESLPSGAVVGTSSPRRRGQLAALRPDLRYENLRGNVDTRLRKLAAGAYDAIVLAMAGLQRLGQRSTYVVPFDVDRIVPAVGQGALAVETLVGDEELTALVREAVNDPASELCIACERAALRALHAGCSAPIGVHARIHDGEMTVVAAHAPEGGPIVRERLLCRVATLEEARVLGEALAARLGAVR